MVRLSSVLILLLLGLFTVQAGIVKGHIADAKTGEPLIGAAVLSKDSGKGAVSDIDGNYVIHLSDGSYVFTVTYVGYKDFQSALIEVGNVDVVLDVNMESDEQALNELTVVAQVRRDSELAVVRAQQQSLVVQSGVGAVQIAKTQDKDAAEVVRRVPGISIIDDKFVMVRGLSQRYNNVWLNGGAVPSSEADSRAFSFDIIPSLQIENMTVVKSPAPEYPSDFTGGFILVNTRRQPTKESFGVSLGYGVNDCTHFREFMSSRGSATDFLGFDNGMRGLNAGMTGKLNTYQGYENRIDLLNNGLNNDWKLKRLHPVGDLKLAANYSNLWRMEDGASLGLLASLNYGNSFKTILDMENSLYGPYDAAGDRPVFLRKTRDNQWSNDVRLGAMLNLSFRPRDNRHLFEWKNIFNQIGKDRYSERTGFNAQADNINNMEYYYSSRTTYNTQFTGHHTFDNDDWDWSAAYVYANRDLPDRRLIERTDRTNKMMSIYRIGREFTYLDENIVSANMNYKHNFNFNDFIPTVKTGVYGEYRARRYRTRQFQYGWQPENQLPDGFVFDPDVAGNVLTDSNYGVDKMYLYEEVNMLNNYNGKQTTLAGYLGVNLPVGSFNIYAGCRYEYVRQILSMNTRQYEESWQDTPYDYSDFFPSINASYKINDRHQLRVAYGRSVNRPEFRELSPSVYYDFELGSNVMGNYDLKAAYIQNIDFRYEWYPSAGEQISAALFYKKFSNPIEWTYTVAGGTDLVYSFVNALGADNYGLEIDVRKNLDFIGMKNFTLSFNGALIKSKVRFPEGGNNLDRPMQGQSPYLINVGLFYNNPEKGWNFAALYNRIGKRIIGVGNRYGNSTGGTERNIPDSYEMPRNSLDLSVSKKFKHWELRFAVRDILAEKYKFTQSEKLTQADGDVRKIEQVNRSYKPGRTFNITVGYNF